MRRILVLILSLCTIFILAVPALGATLESSVVSGDTITDTYIEDDFQYYYEVETTDGWMRQEYVNGSDFTVNLPESSNLTGGFVASSEISIGSDYIGSSARAETQISVIGECSYRFWLYVTCDRAEGDIEDVQLGFYDYEGYVYESQEFVELVVDFDLPDDVTSIYFDIVVDVYSLYDSNVYIEASPISFVIVRNRVDRYEPEPVPPKFEDSMNEAINKEESLVDQFDNGTMSDFGDDIDSAVDSLTQLAYAFAFVRDIVEPFINISWLNTLLVVSLALGILGAFLNLTSSIVNSSKGGKD